MTEAKLKLSVDGVRGVVGGLKQMRESVGEVTESISAMTAIGGAISVGAFAAFLKTSIDAADQLSDLSKATNITVEDLSGLDWAAQLSGTSLSEVAKSVNRLSVEMGKDADRFAKIGVTAKEPLEAFMQLADVFAEIEDPQMRNALANQALGRSYEQLAPLLSEGSEGIRQMIDEGKELSGVTTEMSEQAGMFNDKVDEMFKRFRQVGNVLADDMLPLLNMLVDNMGDATEGVTSLNSGFNPLTETLRALLIIGGNVAFVFKGIGTEIGGIAAQLAALATGDFEAVASIGKMMKEDARKAREEFDAWEKSVLETAKKVADVSLGSNAYEDNLPNMGALNAWAGKASNVAGFLGGNAKSSYDTAIKKSEDFIASIKKEAATVGLTTAEKKQYEAEQIAGLLRLGGASDSYINKFLSNSRKESEALEARMTEYQESEELRKQMLKFSDDLVAAGGRQVETIQDQLKAQREQNEEIGLTTVQLADIAARRLEVEAAADRELAANMRLAADYAGPLHDAYLQHAADLEMAAAAKEQLADEKRAGAATQVFIDEQKKAAEDAQKAWENFTGNVQRNLGDTLYSGLRGDFDNIGDAWLAMIQRMIADAAAADLTAALLNGGKGGGNTSALLGSLGSMISGFFGGGVGANGMLTGSSAYEMSANNAMAMWNAKGNAFWRGQKISEFANGGAFTNGIVSKPTLFDIGGMGEAGPEAIMPLSRGPDGSLGVRASGGGGVSLNVVINNNAPVKAEARPMADGSGIEVLITEIENRLGENIAYGGGAVSSALKSRYGLKEAV